MNGHAPRVHGKESNLAAASGKPVEEGDAMCRGTSACIRGSVRRGKGKGASEDDPCKKLAKNKEQPSKPIEEKREPPSAPIVKFVCCEHDDGVSIDDWNKAYR